MPRLLVFMLKLGAGGSLLLLMNAILGHHPFYLVPALLALGLAVRALERISRKRGWGIEGRLIRHLNRPRFVDQSRRARVS